MVFSKAIRGAGPATPTQSDLMPPIKETQSRAILPWSGLM